MNIEEFSFKVATWIVYLLMAVAVSILVAVLGFTIGCIILVFWFWVGPIVLAWICAWVILKGVDKCTRKSG